MNENNEPFHLSRSGDGTEHWFSARDAASGVSIPCTSRDQAVNLVASLNRAFQHHLKMALTAAPASAAEPEKVAERIYEDAHAGMKTIWGWDDRGLDDEHPGTRERFIGYAKSAMAALGFTIDT